MPRVRVTEEQLLQALRDLGATSSEAAVPTRKVALHLGRGTGYVNDRLHDLRWSPGLWRPRDPAVVGKRSNGGPNYWWAIEDAS